MPIDELKVAIDKWFWPMTLADRKFADDVLRACHALSLDDERPTFRPVLWTDPLVQPGRLTQVWFAGVHANVGGGYPDDGLAYVTMQWIMDEAQLAGARFLAAHRIEVDARVDAHGHQYDSRAGLAGYYRYGPRNVDDLCNDPRHGVLVAMPLVHGDAWERITVRQTAYAPTSFPTSYSLADRPPGGGVLQVRTSVETLPQITDRSADMELVRNAIWRRRFAYFATVFSSAILALLPVFDWIGGLSFWTSIGAWMSRLLSELSLFWQPVRAADQWLAPVSSALSWAVGEQFFPAWVAIWLRSCQPSGVVFFVCDRVALAVPEKVAAAPGRNLSLCRVCLAARVRSGHGSKQTHAKTPAARIRGFAAWQAFGPDY
jgi:hypothetical protein